MASWHATCLQPTGCDTFLKCLSKTTKRGTFSDNWRTRFVASGGRAVSLRDIADVTLEAYPALVWLYSDGPNERLNIESEPNDEETVSLRVPCCRPSCRICSAQGKSWTAIPVGRADYQIWNGDCQLFNLKTKVIGPNWTNARPTALSRVVDGRRVYEETLGFAAGRGQTSSESQEIEFAFHFEASEKSANSFRLRTRTTTNRDTEAIGVGLIVSTTDFFTGGTGTVRSADGSRATFSMPLGMGKHGDAVEEIVLTAVSGEQVVFSFSRPLKVTSDRGELRIWYWADDDSGRAGRRDGNHRFLSWSSCLRGCQSHRGHLGLDQV